MIFNDNGYEVIGYNTGNGLLDSIFELPDLIILDYNLAEFNGLDICKSLKKNERTSLIPVVMISGTPGIQSSCLAAGVNAFLEKPFEMDIIIQVINGLILHTQKSPLCH